MPEQKDKSLDDELKKAEIVRHKAEAARAQAEKAKLDFELKELNRRWWKPRQPLRALIQALLAVIVVIPLFWFYYKELVLPLADIEKIKQAKDFAETVKFQQVKLDSLNREQAIISATIDSLKIRTVISAVFGDLDSLHYANALIQFKMIEANKYFDSRLNPEGKGVENDFKVQVVKGATVIYDAATKLTWQRGSEFPHMSWIEAKAYVDTLTYAGFDDWRLPTLEEAMSLMEPKKNEHGLYIDPIFDKKPQWIWTADKYSASRAWFVSFVDGGCSYSGVDFSFYVRAVR